MYLVIVIVLFLFLTSLMFFKESFTSEDLNVQISPDNQTLTVPNKIKTSTNLPLQILGDVTVSKSATIAALNSGTSNLGTATATTVNIGNATLTNQDGLTINKNVQCNQMMVKGDLTVNGNLCIEGGGSRWYLVSRGGYLHIVKNDPNLSNAYDHRNNEPHVILAPDGNIWISRQSFSGWIADSLSWIRSLGV